MDEDDLIFKCGRTENRGNWVSVEMDGFEIRISDDNKKTLPQWKLKEMCIKCLNMVLEQ